MADRVIQIIIETNDKTGGSLGKIQQSLMALDKAVNKIHNKLRAFATQKLSATISLIDRVTTPGSRINSFLKSLANKVYNISMRVNDSALGKIRQIEATLMKLAARAWTIGINVRDNVTGKIRGLTDGLLMGVGGLGVGMLGTAGIGYGVVNAAQSYMDFEKQMSRVQAVRGLTKESEDMIALTEKAKELGATTAWTRSEAAQAMYYQAMAGWSVPQILAATPAIMNLASAGGTDLATTSDIVTDSLTGFHVNANETYRDSAGRVVNAAEHYADVMAATVTNSNTDIAQLGEALKYSSNVIGAMYSDKDIQTRFAAIEDAMTMTGLMANAGIKGSMAGTSTRAVFSRFGSMNRNAKFALDALGVDFTDKNTGEVRRIRDIMKDLNQRFTEGVSPEHLLQFAEEMSGEKIHADTRRKLTSFLEQTQKNGGKMTGADMLKMSSMLAGQEAMSGFLAAITGDWDKLAGAIENAHGKAKEMADIQLDNLAGDLTILGSAWDAFQQSFFEGQAGEGLRNFVQNLTEIISRANNLFKDGIEISDFGKIIFDVIDRLKNKFLELDGIGSILAGGALIAGLMRIGSTVQKVIGYFKTLKSLEIGQRLGAAATGATSATSRSGLSGGQSVGTMHVTAGVVNVNGKVTGSAGGKGVGNTSIIDRYNREKERIRGTGTPPPSATSTMKSAALGGAAFAGIFGLLDVFNAKSISQERNTEASSLVTVAQREYSELLQRGNASQEEILQATNKIREAQTSQAAIAQENQKYESETLAGATGAVLGTALGSALGSFIGPMGTMLGGIVGGIIGDKTGRLATEIETPLTQNAPPSTVSQKLIEGKVAEQIGTPVSKHTGAFSEIENLGWTGKGSLSYMTDTRKGQNFFGYSGEDILSGYNGKSYEPPSSLESMPELKNVVYNTERKKRVIEDNLAAYAAETEQLKAETKQRQQSSWLKGSGRWSGETYQQQFDAMQAGKAARESTTAHYQEQHKQQFKPLESLGEFFDSLLFSKASAAELTPEQLTQQAAMERREVSSPTTLESIDTSSMTEQLFSDMDSLSEGIGELFSGIGDTITESLSNAFESVGEIFSGLIESISENLSGAFEGIGEYFSEFGASIMENLSPSIESVSEIFSGFGEVIMESLSSAFEGIGEFFSNFGSVISEGLSAAIEIASEIFSTFGEMLSSGLSAAQSAAESALSAIGSAFTSAKDMIQSAWAELPSFFAGIFDGLGGVAASAGAAIYSGLTSVIGAVIGAWQSAASTVSGIISSISAMASSAASMIPSFGGLGGVGKAEGGFVSSETHFFAGEHGPEVVIPLSVSKRARALDLFEQTAAILGGDASIPMDDSLAGELPELEDTSPTGTATLDGDAPITAVNSSNNSVTISLGGVNVTFTISDAESPQEVMETIKENLEELADRIGGQLAIKIGDCFGNMALE